MILGERIKAVVQNETARELRSRRAGVWRARAIPQNPTVHPVIVGHIVVDVSLPLVFVAERRDLHRQIASRYRSPERCSRSRLRPCRWNVSLENIEVKRTCCDALQYVEPRSSRDCELNGRARGACSLILVRAEPEELVLDDS